jgi:Na+/H+ antiporter NhaC
MFAYGVAECFMATGVGASLIILALKLGVTARTVAPISILVTCILSIATGSSWGTFAACAPIFLWLNHLVGGDTILTLCAICGGNARNGSNCGAWYVNVNNAPSNSNWNIGASPYLSPLTILAF